MTDAPVVVCDLRAVQSPDHAGRGIGRWAYELAAAVERARPDLVGAYLLDPEWAPPGAVDELLDSGKLAYLGTPEATRALEQARVYHCFSPFELRRTIQHVRPPAVDHGGMGYSVTVYDLIPLKHASRYLGQPAERRRYTARLEVVRSADAVLAISSAVARDVSGLLHVDPARCHVVGTGVSRHFRPPSSRERALAGLVAAMPELRGSFVLFPAGNEGRKNPEALMAAFARLPGRLRSRLQLVVTGDLPPPAANHYRHLARQAGVADRLVLTGFVTDERLVQLYQAAELVAFPSLAEGYGLPVAEGLACGAVVAVSDRPPLDELVPERRARFDPEDPADIAATLERCLRDDAVRSSVRDGAARTVASWTDVAARAVPVWEALARRPRRPWRGRRRLAVVSPFPPMRSGVAVYSAALVLAMRRAAARRAAAGAQPLEIDCFIDGLDRYPVTPEPIGDAVPVDARSFEHVDGATGSYERVLYVLGNSEIHSNALGALRRRPGAVLIHDVRMSGLMTFSTEVHGAVPGGLRAAIARSYPGLPEHLGASRSVSAAEEDRYGLLLLRDVLAHTGSLFVTSDAARRLAALDAGPELADRIAVAPFAVSWLSAGDRAAVEAARAGRAPGGPVQIASFGIVNPRKRPEVLVAALAELVARGVDARLSLVGGVSEELGAGLAEQAASLGVSARVRVTGDVPWEVYLAELGRTDLAVQLRHRFSGEASGTISECLSAAVPTVVSRIGWMGDIPDEAAAKVAHDCSAAELADALAALVATAGRRASLGPAGRKWADVQTFDAAAEALLDALDL